MGGFCSLKLEKAVCVVSLTSQFDTNLTGMKHYSAMLTRLNNLKKFQSPPRLKKAEPEPCSAQPCDFSGATHRDQGPSLGRIVAAISSLALTAATQSVEAAEAAIAQTQQHTISQQQEIDLVLSSTRAADKRVDPNLGPKWKTPDTAQGQDGGLLYHFPEGAMDNIAAKHVTGDFLGKGAPRLTARGVDPNQFSKKYPEGQVHWQLTEPYKECTSFSTDGNCLETRWSSISYQNISCLYKNEDTGEMVRVLHRSTNTSDTDSMNRGVCAGHRLVKDANGFYNPVQTDSGGNTLYVNPLNIVQMETVSQ